MNELDVAELLRDLALDIVALFILVYLIYFRRYRRRDQVVGYVGFNVSLFTVTAALGSSGPVNVGVGFGLFAVLSIVRLRSDESTQAEIGYTMVALVLGLMAGLPGMEFEIKIIFSVLLVATMLVVDLVLLKPSRSFEYLRIELDRVIVDPNELRKHIEGMLNYKVLSVNVREVDSVRETMRLEVQMDNRVTSSK